MASDESKGISTSAPTYGTPQQMEMVMTPALECLQNVSKVEVQEKANVLEALTALAGMEVEMANKYRVFAVDGEEKREILYAMEETDCINRNFKQCCPDCAPWDVKVLLTDGGKQEQAFALKRERTCTCCCFNRPKVEVTDTVSTQLLGTITDPFACCDLTFTVQEPGNEGRTVKAKGGCCQWGLCCPLPCGPCSTVEFDIEGPSGEKFGRMTKKVPNCCKFLFASDVDNYKLDIENVSDARWKALLVMLTIFVDFRYFSNNKADG